MTLDASKVERAVEVVDVLIETALDGLLANAAELEERPADDATGRRILGHLVSLRRLVTIRQGLV